MVRIFYHRFFAMYIIMLSFPTVVMGVVKINQKIFVDVDAISFMDPQKQGIFVILADNFVKNYLQDNQFPTLFVTAVPLRKGSHDRITKVLYPEIIQEGKMIALDGLLEKSWYFGCVEFENLNRHNESTGTTCRLIRTLDKFGKTADSTITDVRIVNQKDTEMIFELKTEVDFRIQYTVYFSNYGIPAQLFVVNSPTTLSVIFDHLDPDTDYGRLCVIEEPLTPVYTAMGRLIGNKIENCYLSNLKTKPQQLSVSAQPQVQRIENSRFSYDDDRGKTNQSGRFLSSFGLIIFSMHSMLLLVGILLC